jgi:hypothetical protein
MYDRGMKRPYTLKLDEELIAAIKAIKISDGIPESEQIRRGLVMWLESRGAMKSARKRTAARKRA